MSRRLSARNLTLGVFAVEIEQKTRRDGITAPKPRHFRLPAKARGEGESEAKSRLGRRYQNGNAPLGVRLVFGVRRVGGHRPFPPLFTLVPVHLPDRYVNDFGPILDTYLVGMRLQVEIPVGVGGAPPFEATIA